MNIQSVLILSFHKLLTIPVPSLKSISTMQYFNIKVSDGLLKNYISGTTFLTQ